MYKVKFHGEKEKEKLGNLFFNISLTIFWSMYFAFENL